MLPGYQTVSSRERSGEARFRGGKTRGARKSPALQDSPVPRCRYVKRSTLNNPASAVTRAVGMGGAIETASFGFGLPGKCMHACPLRFSVFCLERSPNHAGSFSSWNSFERGETSGKRCVVYCALERPGYDAVGHLARNWNVSRHIQEPYLGSLVTLMHKGR